MPSRDRLSWFRWNPSDHHADPAVRAMSREERGAYREVLDALYMRNTGTANEREIQVWSGYSAAEWVEHREPFARAFRVRGERWTQKRVASEVRAAKHRVEVARKSGRAGARKAWGSMGLLRARYGDGKATP